MKLYYGNKTAWTGDLIADIIWMCGDNYHPYNSRTGIHQVYVNLKAALGMAAEAILTRNSDRNYRYTIETYFHQLCRPIPDTTEIFWNWGQFVLKGRIPYGQSGYYTVEVKAEKVGGSRSLVLELNCNGRWDAIRGTQMISMIKTWKQDILVTWLHRWNWEILRLPIAAESRTMCVGEYLATELFYNCGDEAGRNATLDEIEDRGQKWLMS